MKILNENISKPTNEIVGIDMVIKDFMILSNGIKIENIKSIRNNEKKLKKLQKDISRKVKGSNNRNKARIKLTKLYEKIKNKKSNYIHNITTQLIRENQTIVIEDLNVSGMLKNHKLAKSIQELSLYEVKRQLKYKCEWYGRNLVIIDRWFPSSKKCSKCGFIKKDLKLKDREWICPSCGKNHDRDLNAAVNIENEGKRIIGMWDPEFKFVDYPTMDDRLGNEVLKSSGRMKQKQEKLTYNQSE